MEILKILITFFLGMTIPIVFYLVVINPIMKENTEEINRLLLIEEENKELKRINYLYKLEIKKLSKRKQKELKNDSKQ